MSATIVSARLVRLVMFAGSRQEERERVRIRLLVESAFKANQDSGLPYDTPQLQPSP